MMKVFRMQALPNQDGAFLFTVRMQAVPGGIFVRSACETAFRKTMME